MNDKKIIIATGIFPPDIGGPATYSRLIAEEFSKQGESVVVVTYADKKDSGFPPSPSLPAGQVGLRRAGKIQGSRFEIVRVYRSLPKGLSHFVYFWNVLRIAKRGDVIYAQDPISAGLPACIAAKISRSKFILKVVGDYAWEAYQRESRTKNNELRVSIEEFQDKKFGFFVNILKYLERRVAKSADSVVVPSEYLKKIVLKWGVSESKIKVIYNSYSKENSHTSDVCKLSHTSDVWESEDVLISVGRLVPWKGFNVLIDIMPEFLKENPNFVLCVIGEGPEDEVLKFKVESLKLEGKVFLKGKMSKNELFCALKNAGIFVLNTSYEGFSHQLLEVMDAGIPIVTTNIGGNPEIIKNGENGILVTPNDKQALIKNILAVYKDEDLKKALVENAKKTLEKFNYEKMIKETLDILNK